ncbi:hypothetical protein M5K25_008381 [Dendrobium thyrsiflorum]|uniref:Uncharacterized protein n=1 Tax=Dendrobium thyrsiflorum TaxID=117978 RepID=A0ABD0V929_DENTH
MVVYASSYQQPSLEAKTGRLVGIDEGEEENHGIPMGKQIQIRMNSILEEERGMTSIPSSPSQRKLLASEDVWLFSSSKLTSEEKRIGPSMSLSVTRI